MMNKGNNNKIYSHPYSILLKFSSFYPFRTIKKIFFFLNIVNGLYIPAVFGRHFMKFNKYWDKVIGFLSKMPKYITNVYSNKLSTVFCRLFLGISSILLFAITALGALFLLQLLYVQFNGNAYEIDHSTFWLRKHIVRYLHEKWLPVLYLLLPSQTRLITYVCQINLCPYATFAKYFIILVILRHITILGAPREMNSWPLEPSTSAQTISDYHVTRKLELNRTSTMHPRVPKCH